MRDIAPELNYIMQAKQCDAFIALLLICGKEEYDNAVSILQSESSEESSGRLCN